MSNAAENLEEKRSELVEAFSCAETLQENLDAFKKMKKSELFQESELGSFCWPLAIQLHMKGNNFEKVLSFGKRALELLTSKQISDTIPCKKSSTHFHQLNFFVVRLLNLLGSTSLDLKRYYECLRYFERADKILSELEKEGNNCCPGNCVLSELEITQLGLFEIKSVMSRKEEAGPHMRKVLEIREKTKAEGCMELGKAYKCVYKAYCAAVDIKEALSFCLKALEIYRKHLGCDSVEVAEMMSGLGLVYSEFGECEKALERNLLAPRVMKKVAPDSPDLLKLEIQNGDMLSDKGRYEESIEVFRVVISHAEVEGNDEVCAFIGMAKASFSLGNFDDATKYMKTAQRIYEKEEIDPISIARGFQIMSKLYKKINDRKTAILLVRRVLAIPKIPQKLLLESSTSLFMLTYVVGEEEEAIPYMEDAVEKLKGSVGSKHYEVVYGYKRLGAAYLISGQAELAVKCLTNAKVLMDVHHGPDHLESLETSHNSL